MEQTIKIGGTAKLPGLRFQSATIHESISSISTAQVTFVSETGQGIDESILGQTITLSWPLARGGERHFNGIVGRYGLHGIHDSGRATYSVTLYTVNWKLTKLSFFRIFQNKSVPDIIQECLSQLKIPFRSMLDYSNAQYAPWEFCVLYRESMFNFLSRLMEQVGIYYYFEHTAKDHTMVLCDGPNAHSSIPKYAQLPFAPALGSGRTLEGEHVSSLHFSHERRVTKTMGLEYWFKKDGQYSKQQPSDRRRFKAKVDGPEGSHGLIADYPYEVDSEEEGAAIAQIRAHELVTTALQVEGSSNCAAFCPGFRLKVVDHSIAEFKPELLISSVRVHLHESDNQSGGIGVTNVHSEFIGIPSSRRYAPPRITPKPYVYGPQSALVVGPKNDELYVDEYGRVKVLFAWDRESEGDENASCWIRVATPFAGKGWGFVALPRIGDEVLVHFEDGDPDRPVIIGSLYNADHVTPYPLKDSANVIGLRSRSTKAAGPDNFNELRFDDTKGKEYVWLQAERDFNSLIKNNRVEEVRASRITHVKGNSVERVEGEIHHSVGGDVTSEIKGDAHYELKQDLIARIATLLSVAVEGPITISSDKDTSLETKDNLEVKGGADINIASATASNVNAGTELKIQAGVKISLSVGGSFITIGPEGINITGPLVNVNSGGSASKAKQAQPEKPKKPKEPKKPANPKDPIKGR